MLSIRFAHRYEDLADRLVAELAGGAGSPFDADTVIVPSAAVRRQLTLAIARAHGICANVEFAYLARWLWQRIGPAAGFGQGAQSPLSPELLAWRIFAVFDDAAFVAGHPRLAANLQRADPLARHALAARVAAAFDQLLTYRADWVEAWTRGEAAPPGELPPPSAQDAGWQAALWRRIAAELGPAPALPAFRRAVDAGAVRDWPRIVHVFALPAVPPAHLELLQAIGRWTEVVVHAINPCREFWFDVVSPRQLAALAARGRATHHEVGNPLLASWGRQAQAQLGMLVDAADGDIDEIDVDPPPAKTLLARVQRAILDLAGIPRGPLAADDRSLEIHVCHSPVRELEALHDRLLDLFARPGAPAPGEVLVVTPDLETLAPLVDAVFGTAPRERAIPYTITGRARSGVNAPARALLALLALVGSRCSAGEVFAALSQPVVARRLGLDEDALDRIRRWLRDAGVHWALDAAHRAELDLAAGGLHSLAEGLQRLFLGYALPASAAEPFDGLLPAGDAEGQAAQALGALAHFADALVALRRASAAPRPAAEWPALLEGAITGFIAAGDDELDDLAELRAAVQGLADVFAATVPQQPLPLALVREALAQRLDEPARGGVPGGAVTFSSLASLRSLPYRVVCVLGLNDGAFPATARADEFDLIALRPRPGDRQRRQDDRNVFLDLLLAARETLHLSHVGRSVRDNAPLPPSVVVAELIEQLLPAIAGDAADATARAAARARIVVEHPLQPFAESLFRSGGDARSASFHAEFAQARRAALTALAQAPQGDADAEDDEQDDEGALAAEAAAAPPLFVVPLPAAGADERRLAVGRLGEFFRHPARFLLRERLRVQLPRAEDEIADDEPFVPDIPTRSALAAQVLPALIAGAPAERAWALARAGTAWPGGRVGEAWLADELPALAAHAQAVRALQAPPCLPPLSARLTIAVDGVPWQLEAMFADLRAAGLVRHRYDELRAGDRLDAWLQHLLLCAAAPAGVTLRTTLLGRGERIVFAAVADAQARLAELLRLHAEGLRSPLPFFPKSAWAFVEGGQSLAKARGRWHGAPGSDRGEQADAWNRLAWRGRPDPLAGAAEAFCASASAVFAPMATAAGAP
jgi:exodeoxyribonuclease V gamma subunit